MKRFYLIFISLLICLVYTGCGKWWNHDDKLTLPREPYYGDALRLDGYYYQTDRNGHTGVFFLYRNGVTLDGFAFDGVDLDIVEKEMIGAYDKMRKNKYSWGIFIIRENTLEAECWRSVGMTGGLHAYKFFYNIENDTTLRYIKDNEIWHFKQFSPKPDSTNRFIN